MIKCEKERRWRAALFRYVCRILNAGLSALAAVALSREMENLTQRLTTQYDLHKAQIKNDIPTVLIDALLQAEDHRFYGHYGVDPLATCRALIKTALCLGIEGGSTIEQQLVRVITGRRERTFRRKAREILLSTAVYRAVNKNDVPGLYLLLAYYGWRMNGLLAACQRLNLDISALDNRGASAIIARLKFPEPKVAPPFRAIQIRERQNHICQLLKMKDRVCRFRRT